MIFDQGWAIQGEARRWTSLRRYFGAMAHPHQRKRHGYAQDTLAWAKAKQLIGGTSATTLDPAGSATRAQVVAILMRFGEMIVE